MFKVMKSTLFLLCFTVSAFICSGQSNNSAFSEFLGNFENTQLPLNVIEFRVRREGDLNSKYILKMDFNKYLREKGDTYWKFEEFFDYQYGGKLKIDNLWVVFYSRHFVPDDIFVQKGEFVIVSFSLTGEQISALPVAGGYGDSLTFDSVISDFKDIKINFKSYENGVETDFTKSYFMDKGGVFKIKPENK